MVSLSLSLLLPTQDGSAIHHTLNSAVGQKWRGLPDPRNTLRRSGCDGWSFCDFDLAP